MRRKIGLFNLRNVVYKEEETKTEHAIGLYPRKTIYLDILTMHAQLHAKLICYLLFTFLTPHLVYINSSILSFSPIIKSARKILVEVLLVGCWYRSDMDMIMSHMDIKNGILYRNIRQYSKRSLL